MFDLDAFWEALLSEEEAPVKSAYASLLDDEERAAIVAHLQAMATEPDWADVQRQAAQAALKILGMWE